MPQGDATLLQLSEIAECVNDTRCLRYQMQLKHLLNSDTTGDSLTQWGPFHT